MRSAGHDDTIPHQHNEKATLSFLLRKTLMQCNRLKFYAGHELKCMGVIELRKTMFVTLP